LRTGGYCLALQAQGIRLAPNQSATKLAVLLDMADPTRSRDLCAGTVDSWVAWTLSRGTVHVSDRSNLAVTGLLDGEAADWDETVLEALRIPHSVLPRPVDSLGVLGDAAALPGAPPIAGLAGDQQASLVGQGCVRPGLAKATFGTGGMLDLCVGPERPEFPRRGPGGTFPIVAWSRGGNLTWGIEAIMMSAGSCVECPKRTGHNKLLFAEVSRQDACSDPRCFSSKVEAHIQKTLVEKPKLVQISTAYGVQRQDSPVLPRNKYVAIRQEKPANKQESTRPEFKTCKFTTEAIVSEGSEKGEIQKVCANPACPIHHAKRPDQHRTDDAKWKAEQEKRRREEAIANATGIRILSAIAAAVPVRLMKRDLLFVAEKLAVMLDQPRLEIAARQSGIKKSKASESVEKLFLAFLRRADEGTVGKLLVEIAILLAASRRDSAQTLSNAAEVYKVDVEAIRQKVRQEFTARQKATQQKGPATTKPQAKARKTA